MAYQQNPDKDQVAKDLETKINDPKEPKFYNLAQAMYYERLKDYNKATEVYNRMIENNLFTTLAKNNLAYLLATQTPSPENFDRALKLVSEALDEAPEDANILDTKGWILCQKGDYRQAHNILGAGRGIHARTIHPCNTIWLSVRPSWVKSPRLKRL